MKRSAIAAFAALLISASAAGQVTYRYSEWADGPVKHLMTKEEMKQWKALRTDEEAQAFIDLFWAKRDPTPDTPRNEFREEFDARVALADQQFSGLVRGAMSDPGKVLILLGLPERVSGRAGAQAISSLGPVPSVAPTDAEGNVLVPSPTREPNRQVWTYAHDHKPKYVNMSDFLIVFLDEGHNDWKLARTERTNPDVVLMQAVNGLIVSPKLTKAPFSSTAPARNQAKSFKESALDAAYKQFRSGDKTAVGPASLTWGEFVTPSGQNFISVQLYVPAGADIHAGQNVTFFSVIENDAGEIVEIDEQPSTLIASGTDAYVDRSLPLGPGSYIATFGLAADGRLLSANRIPMKVEGLDPSSSGISSLILSNNVYPLQTAWGPSDPFTFGGLKVVPKGDALFAPKGDLWYFVELRKPGVTPGGGLKIQVQVNIAGKTAKGPVAMNIPLKDANPSKLKGTLDRYAVGVGLPLEGFPPGEYKMKVRLVDTVLGKTWDLEREFRVRGL